MSDSVLFHESAYVRYGSRSAGVGKDACQTLDGCPKTYKKMTDNVSSVVVMESQLLERICEKLDDIVRILNDICCKHDTLDAVRKRREESLEKYRRDYERQHGVIEINSDCEDEIN